MSASAGAQWAAERGEIGFEMDNASPKSSPSGIECINSRCGGCCADLPYAQYKQYLSDVEEHRLLQLRTLHVELCLENSGTRPATNIDVEFDLPEGLSLFELKKLPTSPAPPKRPALDPDPMTIGQAVHTPIDFSGIASPRHWTKVDPVSRHVRFHVAELKHGYITKSDTFAIAFTTAQQIGQKELQFSISANEIPEPSTGFIPLEIMMAND